jgi:hypothetical protein
LNEKTCVLRPTTFLLPKAKRRKAHAAVQKSVRFPSETAHFTKETTASRLKKVEKQKAMVKGEMRFPKKGDGGAEGGAESGAGLTIVPGQAETRSGPESRHEIDHQLHEREIRRYISLFLSTSILHWGGGESTLPNLGQGSPQTRYPSISLFIPIHIILLHHNTNILLYSITFIIQQTISTFRQLWLEDESRKKLRYKYEVYIVNILLNFYKVEDRCSKAG